ncbi:MAG: energy-coupling factor transporter transmembrane protein EcfT [Muribaculaceae bacterium]|nr:energy-coupling factor transporter transmembrane protein EcfT [Muribaculaceae bacterium]
MKQSRLEKAITILNARQMKPDTPSHIGDIDVRALLGVTIIFLVTMLSVPLQRIDVIIWFAAYPIISSPLAHVAYEKLFRNSLFVLPLLIFIGIPNPIYDRTPALNLLGITVSAGWISFLSILIRGLLAAQALMLLIRVSGFNEMCLAMRRLGCPAVIVTQLMMAYRYMSVLLQEALTMQRARMARSYGKNSFGVSMWGPFVGQLLLRTIERARRVDMAMKARGVNGVPDYSVLSHWDTADTVYCMIWIPVLLILRFADVSSLMLTLLQYRLDS